MPTQAKNVLFIAFQFHPVNIGGSHRAIALARYFPSFNINPVVVTLGLESIRTYYDVERIDTQDEQPYLRDLTIHRIEGNSMHKSRLRKYFSYRDSRTDIWEKEAEQQIAPILQQHSIEAIVVTAPPFTMASFARKLAKKHKLPLLLDMRDAWTYWNVSPYTTWFHYKATRKEEHNCFKQADVVTVTSQQTLDDFISLHPSVASEKFQLVLNGYDELRSEGFSQLDSARDKIIIGYSGVFYYRPDARIQMLKPWWKKKMQHWLQFTPRKEDWLYRSPYFFFKTMQHLQVTNPALFGKIEVHFIGAKPEWFDDMVKAFGLQGIVRHFGQRSHKESLQFQLNCDVLLLTSSKVIGGRDYSIAGKTYEYISMLKPVLAFVTDGAQKDILEKAGIALLCDPDNTEESTRRMSAFLSGRHHMQPDMNFINSLSRYEQIRRMSDIIHEKL